MGECRRNEPQTHDLPTVAMRAVGLLAKNQPTGKEETRARPEIFSGRGGVTTVAGGAWLARSRGAYG